MADMTYTGLGNSYTTNGVTQNDWVHGNGQIYVLPEQESQKGGWIYEVYPICDVCGTSDVNCIVMPYGSRYDGSPLCANCIKELIDPILDRLIKDR